MISTPLIQARVARKLSLIALGLAGVVFLSAMALVAYSAVELARFSRAETRRAVFIHVAGQSLEPGVNVAPDRPGGIAGPSRLHRDEGGADRTRAVPSGGRHLGHLPSRRNRRAIRLEVRDERIARVTRDGKDARARRWRARC